MTLVARNLKKKKSTEKSIGQVSNPPPSILLVVHLYHTIIMLKIKMLKRYDQKIKFLLLGGSLFIISRI